MLQPVVNVKILQLDPLTIKVFSTDRWRRRRIREIEWNITIMLDIKITPNKNNTTDQIKISRGHYHLHVFVVFITVHFLSFVFCNTIWVSI